jgi:hypothetical protein
MTAMKITRLVLVCASLAIGLTRLDAGTSRRRVISLDGQGQIEEGKLDAFPARFTRTAPVPGLADMATPPFDAPGSTMSSTNRRDP